MVKKGRAVRKIKIKAEVPKLSEGKLPFLIKTKNGYVLRKDMKFLQEPKIRTKVASKSRGPAFLTSKISKEYEPYLKKMEKKLAKGVKLGKETKLLRQKEGVFTERKELAKLYFNLLNRPKLDVNNILSSKKKYLQFLKKEITGKKYPEINQRMISHRIVVASMVSMGLTATRLAKFGFDAAMMDGLSKAEMFDYYSLGTVVGVFSSFAGMKGIGKWRRWGIGGIGKIGKNLIGKKLKQKEIEELKNELMYYKKRKKQEGKEVREQLVSGLIKKYPK